MKSKLFTPILAIICLIGFTSCAEEIATPNVDTTNVQELWDVYQITLSEDSTVDQTASIQKQLDAIPDGTPTKPNIIRFPDGRFWTEGDLENNSQGRNGIINLTNRHNLIIEGGTFYTKAPATAYGGNVDKGDYSRRRHFWLIECTNITLRKIRVEGSNTIDGRVIGTTPTLTPSFWQGGEDNGALHGSPAYRSYWELEHAFDIRGCKNITLEDCFVFGVWGDGVYVGGTTSPSENIVLRNLHLRFTGRQGIGVANSVDGLLIDKVWVDKGRRASIDLEPHNHQGFVRNVKIQNCRLEAVMVAIAAAGRGDVSNIYIHNNTYTTTSPFLVCHDSSEKVTRENWTVKNNTRIGAFGSPVASIRFKKTNNIVLEGNTDAIKLTQSRTTVQLIDCKEANILENNFGHGYKIISKASTGLTVKENVPEQVIVEL
ncbi:hypothetical protein CLV24_1133 [Pontibacter ummariensis]|uniref:Right handed beta helix region n=1 Tax=Pontibacter ummariensis TaxID=1610492 RepID=A0A239HGZ6_9BACT|nr:right-handed parallel beta-helix repeat-containing protein [Pontibacter ummariensis]PRY10584.1 hypothetical protein CLV24_1133 [Pontibacter ummariensis]SNS80637.1 Right handed beta helix region [Pontibacter ummariensis]